MFQSKGIIPHLIADKELFSLSKLRKHIVLFRHGPKPFLIPQDRAPGNVLFHGLPVALLKTDGAVPPQPMAVPVYLAFIGVEVHLIDAQIIHAEGMQNVVAALLKLPNQIPPFQGGHDKVRCSLEHIRRIFQRLHGRIVHTVKADDLFTVIKGNHHKGVDVLPLQVLILEGIRLPNVFQILNDDMPAYTEIPIPVGAHLRRDILKVFLLRLHPIGRPLIGIVIFAGLVALKYIGAFPVQRLSQMLQQHLQRLIRSLLQQGDAKPLIDDGLQILNTPHTAVLITAPDAFSLTGPLIMLL